jgi:urease gamma subunit
MKEIKNIEQFRESIKHHFERWEDTVTETDTVHAVDLVMQDLTSLLTSIQTEIEAGKFSTPPYAGNEDYERGVNVSKDEDIALITKYLQ